MLGPSWLDPQSLIESLGPWALLGITAIIFAECGLLIGFFLPGDSLLFVAGLLVASGFIDTNIALVCLIFTIAAVAGNVVGYWIGRKAGPTIFSKPDSKLFRQEYVDRTQHFFDHYGVRAIIIARFIPIVRTFITVMAGVGRMDYRTYVIYSTIGGILWATGVTVLGYLLGNVPFVANNIEAILIGVVLLSVTPVVFEYFRHKRAGGVPDAEQGGQGNA
ncbi:MAG: VTT domain-containing protein [Actinomycetia bacterium]|nr:VTT domain-containing protein [Actinomycetes bacterium]